MGHDLREGEQQAVLDEPAQGAHRLLPRPAEVARWRGHDGALLGPAVRAGRGPVPTAPHSRHVLGDTSDGSEEPAEPPLSRGPGHKVILWFTLWVAPSATADGMSEAMENELKNFFCQK